MIFIFCNRKNGAKEYANPIPGFEIRKCWIPSCLMIFDDFHFFAIGKMTLGVKYVRFQVRPLSSPETQSPHVQNP